MPTGEPTVHYQDSKTKPINIIKFGYQTTKSHYIIYSAISLVSFFSLIFLCYVLKNLNDLIVQNDIDYLWIP